MKDRGPDDTGFLGYWSDGPGRTHSSREAESIAGSRLGLVHTRLSVLDLSDGGWQPKSTSDGRFHMVFNGEIYNYRELRVELESAGQVFTSSGDTEVLLAALVTWGKAALERLVGMFAFALLDVQERRLLLVRDFFGIKPLYYSSTDKGFVFASSLRSLLELRGSHPRAATLPTYDFLRYGISDHLSDTMVEGVHRLPPAHLLDLPLDQPNDCQPRCYWQLEPDLDSDISFEEAADRLRDLFVESVQMHLRSDVPVGAALSGGIDSSAIVMAMREISGKDLDLHTISYVADEEDINEDRWSRLVARSSNSIRHTVQPRHDELIEDLERLIEVQDEPFGSTSVYAQFCVFRAASRAGLTVMLDGQGADELLAGYRPYLAARLVSLLRQGRWPSALGHAKRMLDLPGETLRDLVFGLGFQMVPHSAQRLARHLIGKPFVPDWLHASWFEDIDTRSSPIPRTTSRHALRELLVATVTRTSLPMLLRFEDRNSMAFSIESRVPFLTPQLAEFALGLPEHYLVDQNGTSKAVFRAAMRGLVPDEVLDRKDKIGFVTPELSWLRRARSWVEETLGSDAARTVLPLNLEHARTEWEGVLSGQRRFDWHVWRWICLIRWAEHLDVSFER